jgi:hypothetical protein
MPASSARAHPTALAPTAWRHLGDSTPHLQDKSAPYMLGGEVSSPRTARAQRLSGPRRAEKVLEGEAMEFALQACVEVSYREVVKVVVQIGVPARRHLGQEVGRP